jgi:hypothetical protein
VTRSSRTWKRRFRGARTVELVALALVAASCGAESVVRYEGEGGKAGERAEPPTGGSRQNGGTTSGETGGAVTGGSRGVETGGSGGAAAGGAAGACTGGIAGACTGDAVIEGDPYPRVEFENGNGYVDTCQEFPGGHGFACWNFDGARSEYCDAPGSCNACLCYVPCDRESGGVSECPAGFTGTATPSCVHETPNTNGACMLVCDESTTCPDGMTCAPYPELPILVCMWLAAR